MTTPTLCRVTGNVATIGLAPAVGLALYIAPEPKAVRRANDVLIVPEPVTVTVTTDGEIDVSLLPGRYMVSARQGASVFGKFAITVPSSTVATIAQLLDAPAPPTLNAAQLAVLDAQSARDAANVSAAAADADRIAAEIARTAAQTARDAAAASQTAAAGSATQAAGSATAAAGSATAAAGSATAAASSATTASTKAAEANTARIASEAAQVAAAASEDAADASADAAQASALAAAGSASTATTAKDAAITAKTAAQASEAAADTSADAAFNSATAAAASATAAANSATAASNSEDATAADRTATGLDRTAAAASASAAAASETAAATSASASAASATASQTSRLASEAARDSSISAKTASETARDAAVIARAGAETARTGAEAAQAAALISQTAANTSAGLASGSAASALAIYGSVTAQQAAVATAQAQASLAAGHAASAASVVQQDLSGITAQALHRSPNAVTAMAIYDTSKDSDGGAWTEKCQHTSWYNEPLSGKWLGAQVSEQNARYVGASLGAELLVNGDYSSGTTGWTQTAGNFTVEEGRAKLSGANARAHSAAFATVVGKIYEVRGTIVSTIVSAYFGAVRTDNNQAITSIGTPSSGIGEHRFYFVAATATTYIYIGNGGGAGTHESFFDNISVREVTALNTASNDYFQLTTDGKFYRLWKNLISRSEEFDHSNWVKTNSTVSANAVVAPDGTTTADAIIPTGTGFSIRASTSLNATGTYTASVSVKDNGAGSCAVAMGANTVGYLININLSTGAFISGRSYGGGTLIGYTITSQGNGWWRVSVSATASVANISIFNADGTSPTQGVLIWGAQLEYGSTATAYEPKAAEGSISEVFRGNKADFPRLAAIVAEASNVNIYDLTEPGRPMWMRFNGGTGSVVAYGTAINSVAILNGEMIVGSGSSQGLSRISFFEKDYMLIQSSSYYTVPGRGYLINRNGGIAWPSPISADPRIANSTVNAVAMTVLPDAPIDPATGLRVPTIAVATGGGVSVIKHNGTVVNSASAIGFEDISLDPHLLGVSDIGSSTWFFATKPGALGASFVLSTAVGNAAPGFGSTAIQSFERRNRGEYIRRSGPRVNALKQNEGDIARSLSGEVTNTFNTGWLPGDVRRCFLSDTSNSALVGEDYSILTLVLANLTIDANVTVTDLSDRFRITKNATDGLVGGIYVDTAIGALTVGRLYFAEFEVLATGPNNNAHTGATHGGGGAFIPFGYSTGNLVRNIFSVATGAGHGGVRFNFSVSRGASPASSQAGDWIEISKRLIVRSASPDLSYKGRGVLIDGTLTRAALATGTSLVGYSGFSAANYLREPYSADLDFGTGEWSCSAWVNTAATNRRNVMTYSEQFDNAAWNKSSASITANAAAAPDGTTTADLLVEDSSTSFHFLQRLGAFTQGTTRVASIHAKASTRSRICVAASSSSGAPITQYICVDLTNGSILSTLGAGGTVEALANGWYRISLAAISVTLASDRLVVTILKDTDTTPASYAGDGVSGVLIWGAQGELGSTTTAYQRVVDGTEILAAICDRAHSSGPRIRLSVNGNGNLTAEAFDGTTTRSVTTTAAYNTATWLKAEACYTTDGTLSIRVNGREVVTSRGNPLLTLNNSSAVLTIGNSFALDAPFPGSIALLKLGATVPTRDQAQFMYEQEKQLFRAGAQSVLPDSGSIVDMSYDDATDRWVAVSATNESYWTGLVRNSVTPVPAGSYTRVVAGSGLELVARSTTNPGVDVTIPAYGLREELVKRAEAAARLTKEIVTYDYVGGFTANTTNGSTAITNVSAITYPASYIGARISGAGIPANTTIVAVSGTTIYLSAAATATASGVSISFLDFELPVGMEAKTVMSAGSVKQEGATKDFTRLYDGFIETIRFGVAPGVSAWVQIQATRGTMQ